MIDDSHTTTATDQIDILRSAFGAFETMDPDGPAYKKLCAILDRADNDALAAAYAAKIRFVSKLALNRMIRRGLVPAATTADPKSAHKAISAS